MTPDQPAPRPLLALTATGGAARRHGSRSLATCHYRCGSACDKPVPNTTGHGHVQEEITKVVGRRRVLQGAAALGVAGSIGGLVASPVAAAEGDKTARGAAAARTTGNLGTTSFRPVAPNTVDAVRNAPGFTHDVIVRWGDPILPGAPRFDAHAQTPEAAQQQFGYNCDYVGLVPTRRDKALLVVNHEYTNEELMFPAGTYTAEEVKRLSMLNHGMSVVTLKRGLVRGSWRQVKNLRRAPQNRRLHIDTPFRIDGPAAGDARLRTTADPTGRLARGTLNNCSGGMTPWGTVLSGEENFNQYFDGTPPQGDDRYARYGITGGTGRGWSSVDPRFSLDEEPNEPHRFGWIVEVDPTDPTSTPRKHSMLGRFKHEGANVVIARDGRAVAHMGDDERGDYLYKFVSAGTYLPGSGRRARRNNLALLTKGTLYVAQLNGDGTADGVSDGTGTWIPLCSDTESFVNGMSVADVLIFTRLAADRVGDSGNAPTRMDRPEDVEHNPVNGKVYAALTNNVDRGTRFPVDEANPVAGNRNGYVLEMTPDRGNHAGTTFTWNLFLICGDPSAAETYYGGYPKDQVSPISCPDNVAFDKQGNLWISTDGNALGSNDGVFRVPVEGPERGRVKQFLSVPRGAEACGPLLADDDRSLFFAVQHPGEDDGSTFENPWSTWPHTNAYPRPSVCVAFKAR